MSVSFEAPAARSRSSVHSGLGLATKIIGLAILVALLTGGSIGIVLIISSRRALREHILESDLAAADIAAHLASSYIEGAEATLRSFSSDPQLIRLIKEVDLAAVESYLARILEANSLFDNAVVYTSDGIGWASALKKLWQYRGGSVADREWFRQTVDSREPYFGIPILSRGTGNPVATFAIPLFASDGRIDVIIAGGISLAALSDQITGLRESAAASASLLDSRNGGIIVAHPQHDRILQALSGANPAELRAIAGEKVSMEVRGDDGQRYLAACAPVQGLPWSILIMEPIELAYAPLRTLSLQAALSALFVILLAAALGALLAGRVIRPVGLLVEGARELGRGNLSHRITVSSRDEIGHLSEAFNRMAESLFNVTASRDDLNREIAERRKVEEALQKTLEELKRSNQDLEQFAYVASHDLQEPLRMVSSYTQLLEQRYATLLDQNARDFIWYAVDGANRMQHLIQDLLAYSRVTTRGREPEPVDTQAALAEALVNLQVTITESAANITNEDLPMVMADGSQLVQLFQNLIGNAMKFSRPDVPPRVHVGVVRAEGDGHFATMSVEDNGIGIEAKYIGRLFVIFQRLHARNQYPGTGIGLALCKRIVERHGGRIWVESQPGVGTKMLFTLPLRSVSNGEMA